MKRTSLKLGALLGGLTALPLLGLLYLAYQVANLPFVPFDIFDWVARVLPGDLVTFGIDSVVSFVRLFNVGRTDQASKTVEQLLAVIMFIVGAAILGLIVAWLVNRSRISSVAVGAAVGAVAFAATAAVTLSLGVSVSPILSIAWLAATIIGWGALLGHFLTSVVTEQEDEEVEARRAALIRLVAGSAGIALGAWGLGRWLSNQGAERQATGAGQPLVEVGPTSPSGPQSTAAATPAPNLTATATARDRVAPAPGTRPEVTSNEDFYRIDINAVPPMVNGDQWQLEVEGLFDNPRPMTKDDLMAYPPITQPITLSCISNRIGGDLIGTSYWTGVRLRDVLRDLGLKPEAKELFIEATDGFYESVVMEDMMDPRTLLVYGMNDETLPAEHGYPLRIYIPNRYGMKQPKWIIRMTAINEDRQGYWVVRGWSKEARPKIVSVIDTVDTDQPTPDGLIPVGGIAWAGDRGIQKVELQFDDGDWAPATLRTPPLSPLTWLQWRYDWQAEPGRHQIRVRATDGTGALQVEEQSGVRPDGATGYHRVNVSV
jgi:DMSO/TMAO reductase YedYZ molybdopterin-dependent catalytic subunit